MGKLIALLSAGSGTVVVSVGGIYMVQNSLKGDGQDSESRSSTEDGKGTTLKTVQSGGNSQTQETTGTSTLTGAGNHGTPNTQTEPEADNEWDSSPLKDFNNKKGYKCISSLFDVQNLDIFKVSGITSFSDTDPSAANFFGSPATDANQIKSCLIIDWEKKTYSDNKWTGKFSWTWSFMNGDKGFVVANTVDAGTDSPSTLTLKGGAYLLEKKSEGVWEVKYKETVETDIVTTNDGFEKYLPKAKVGSGVSVEEGDDTNYWGFIKDADDLKNVYDVDSADEGTTPTNVGPKKFEWTWKTGGNKKVSEWSENLDWWDKMYSNSSFDLQTKLDNFKGTWSKVDSSTSDV